MRNRNKKKLKPPTLPKKARRMGLEPMLSILKTDVLPLNYLLLYFFHEYGKK